MMQNFELKDDDEDAGDEDEDEEEMNLGGHSANKHDQ